MKQNKPNIIPDIIDKWQKEIKLIAELTGYVTAIFRNNTIKLEVLVSSAPEGGPFSKERRFYIDDNPYFQSIITSKKALIIQNKCMDARSQDGSELNDISSFLGMPLLWPDKDLFGIIILFDKKEREIPTLHQELAAMFKESIETDLTLHFKTKEYNHAKELVTKLKQKQRKNYEIDIEKTNSQLQSEISEIRNKLLKFSNLSEKGSDIIFTIDENGFYTWINPAIEQLLGYKREEMIGKKFIDTVSAPWQKKTKEDFKKLVSLGEIKAETVLLDKTGRSYFVEHNSTVIKENNQFIEIRGIIRNITQRKIYEQKLLEKERNWRLLLQNISDIIIRISPDGTILEISRTIKGLTQEKTIGKKIYEYILPEHHPKVKKTIEYVFTTGKSDSYEILGRGIKEGYTAWYETTVIPIKYNNKVIEATQICRDITEKVKIQEMLQRNEQIWRLLAQNSSDIIITINEAETILSIDGVNRNFLNKKAIGKRIHEYIFPNYRALIRKYIKNSFKKGIISFCNVQIKGDQKKNNTWYKIRIVPHKYNGVIKTITLFCSDISECVKINEKLQDKEIQISKVFEEGPLGMAILDLKNNFTYVNQKLCKMLGYEAKELLKFNFKKILHPQNTKSPYVTNLRNLSCCEIEKQYIKKNNDSLWGHQTSSVIYNQQNKPIYKIIMIVDVTKCKMKDVEIIQSQKLASIGQLAAGVAHEINNPLSALSGEIQWLRHNTKEKDLLKSMRFMNRVCGRIGTIINNLLIFSQDTANKTNKPADINKLINTAILLLSRQFNLNKVKIKTLFDKNLPILQLDKGEIEQVFLNLLLNSLDAMHEGGRITISTKLLNNKKNVEIKITDTGKGIEKDKLDKVFEPFFTTKAPGRGTGLGLYIVHGIIKKHKGKIYIESSPGRGTTVLILLPVKQNNKILNGNELPHKIPHHFS